MGARQTGDYGENTFSKLLALHLPENYEVYLKPDKLQLYTGGKGIILDSLVVNRDTGKCLFIEKKTGNNGGNAHERVYKFLSQGLRSVVGEKYNTCENPFFLVFSGDTFQRTKYQDEISLLLEGENYAIMDHDYGNIEEVARQITEIV
jgi:hypothetical protein